MEINRYYQSRSGYFWQWEDNGEVLAIPDNSTIAYRRFLLDILARLAPQGIPPLGSILLAIIATNPDATQSINTVFSILKQKLQDDQNQLLNEAISFLKLLSEVPAEYKTDRKRLLLLQSLFEESHNLISPANANRIVSWYSENNSMLTKPEPFVPEIFQRDFKTIGLLNKRFRTTQEILEQMSRLPEPPEIELPAETERVEIQKKDLIDDLIENEKTYAVGSLVRRIWSGLNIPMHHNLPSNQPIGGISDLTNKGSFDRLLISEYANDDLVFLSRLANNEALYIHREIPPSENRLQRVILLDVSLKSWGTPKTLAFATMLAISMHPKTTISCSAFAIGKTWQPVSFLNVHQMIASLQLLDGCLDASKGMEAFFKDHPDNRNREIFLITTKEGSNSPDMLKMLSQYSGSIVYWIYTDAEGNIEIFKSQQKSKRHIQHIRLPLLELWKRAPIPSVETKTKRADYPILLKKPVGKAMYYRCNGFVYVVSSKGLMFRCTEVNLNPNKGWELVFKNLPIVSEDSAIGQNRSGELILLIFNRKKKELSLLNLETGNTSRQEFNHWKQEEHFSFLFYDGKFHHFNDTGYWGIDPDGEIEKDSEEGASQFISENETKFNLLKSLHFSGNIFKNVTEVAINENERLVFNSHELYLNKGNHLKLEMKFQMPGTLLTARRINEDCFQFKEGSTVEIEKGGLLILNSSDNTIPTFYIASAIDESIAAATSGVFAGNTFYYKEETGQIMITTLDFNSQFILPFINNIIRHGSEA